MSSDPPTRPHGDRETLPRKGMPGARTRARSLRLPAWLRSPSLHEWVRTSGIIIAASWGIYTFVWKEIYVPSQAPASITLEISLIPMAAEGGSGSSSPSLQRELKVSATNASTRRLYLLSSFWELFPIRRQVLNRSTFPSRAIGPFDAIHVERGAVLQPYPTEAAGKLFVDDHINPGETIHRSVIVSLPAGAYAAQVDVLVPVLTREPPKGNALLGGRVLEWGYDRTDVVIPLLCVDGDPSDCLRLDDPEKQDRLMDRKLKAFDSNYFLNEQSVQVGLSGGS
ncbi:hypothetical protein KBZ08_04270 [Cyanobium sp. Candia 9D4]|uniref:hypothetical protein n=1 Tax=Cyanobium sp. Candia 9D4 TaxID=2823707 RepID=UPI0020CDA0BE|nr:hypothetical protein [Cyanobium sp. Candia 9D4]MCP9933124.1 hypothetical protein [Cyanobium sp. Candia 9D4]